MTMPTGVILYTSQVCTQKPRLQNSILCKPEIVYLSVFFYIYIEYNIVLVASVSLPFNL